jgi:3-hydroxy-9,10-secoandrosta-1,3,5(10)-triene-9,17-dione monooxygenase
MHDQSTSSKSNQTIEAVPDAATLIARAEALIPLIREGAAEAEARGHFSDEVLQAFREAGFYRMFLPKMFGGYESSHETFLEVSYQVAVGDPGTSWCYTLSASHIAVVASLLDERAQRELVEPHGELRSPHRAPPGGRAVRVDGGYNISGRWRYSSGVPVSTHFMANTLCFPEGGGAPEEFTFITAVENVTILPDWGGGAGLGVQASGSNTVEIIEPVFVPEHHIMHQDTLFGADVDWEAGTPGTRLHGSGHYLGVFGGFYHLCFAAIFSGAAQAATDHLRELGQRTPALLAPPGTLMKDSGDIQRALGRVAAMADASHAIMVEGARMSDALLDRWERTREPITRAETMRLWAMGRQAAILGCEAVHVAYRAAGPAATARNHPLQRLLRDSEMYLGHASTQPAIDLARGQAEFGVPIEFGPPPKGQ